MLRFSYLLNIYCEDKLICLFASSFDSASATDLSSLHCFIKIFMVLHERLSILTNILHLVPIFSYFLWGREGGVGVSVWVGGCVNVKGVCDK